MEIKTERLLLRQFRDEDLLSFSNMNRDLDVMEFIGPPLVAAQNQAMLEKISLKWKEIGFGLFAVEIPGEVAFIGFVGLSVPTFQAHFTPCIEIGWRLAKQHWGQGYATEGAKAVKHFAFNTIGLMEIVSFTAVTNLRSQRVMEKIGFTRDPREDFSHPNKLKDDPLRAHVLYRGSKYAS